MERTDRINELIMINLAEAINRHLNVPGFMVTISKVDTSPDLKRANISFSVLPDKFFGQALSALRSASPMLRAQLAKSMKIKFIPRLVWEIDDGPKYAASLEPLFQQIEEEESSK